MNKGNPNWIVPTPPLGDSSKRTANTEFVTLAVAAAATGSAGFASGTIIIFQQASAPTGWTRITTNDDAALRIVSGAVSTGGVNGFSTVMAQTQVGSTALVLNQIPPHTHTYNQGSNDGTLGDSGVLLNYAAFNQNTSVTSGSTGGSGGVALGHQHTITMNMKFVDVIAASKD